MRRHFFSVEQLEPPFLSVDELVNNIPPSGQFSFFNHDFKLLYFLEGEFRLHLEGQGTFEVGPHDLLLVPFRCGQTYFARPDENGEFSRQTLHTLRIIFAPSVLPLDGAWSETEGRPEADFAAFGRHHFSRVWHVSAAHETEILETQKQLRFEARERKLGYRHRVHSLCLSLSILAVRLINQEENAAVPERRVAIVERTRQFLDAHFHEKITLRQLAKHLNLTEEHLCRVWKKATGQTIFEALEDLRIERAKELLLDSTLEIKQIARQTGFSSSSALGKHFKKYVGQTPQNYRNRHARSVLRRS